LPLSGGGGKSLLVGIGGSFPAFAGLVLGTGGNDPVFTPGFILGAGRDPLPAGLLPASALGIGLTNFGSDCPLPTGFGSAFGSLSREGTFGRSSRVGSFGSGLSSSRTGGLGSRGSSRVGSFGSGLSCGISSVYGSSLMGSCWSSPLVLSSTGVGTGSLGTGGNGTIGCCGVSSSSTGTRGVGILPLGVTSTAGTGVGVFLGSVPAFTVPVNGTLNEDCPIAALSCPIKSVFTSESGGWKDNIEVEVPKERYVLRMLNIILLSSLVVFTY